jgi:hypothetical protein
MFRIAFWNPDKEPNKAGITQDKEEAWTCPCWVPDMSGHSLWNPAKVLDMSGLTEDIYDKVVFDVLHFTNSPNAPPLIVRSCQESNKI